MFELIAFALLQLFSITGTPAQGTTSFDGGSGGWGSGVVASKGGSGGWGSGIVAPTNN